MSRSITFSEFLKEGALKKEKKPRKEQVVEEKKPFHIVGEDGVGEGEQRAFWKRLRNFFRTGEDAEQWPGAYVPALIAPYLTHEQWDTDYPFYFSGEERDSLESMVRFHLEEQFDTDKAKILRENVARWLIYAKELLDEHNGFMDFTTLRDRSSERLKKLEVRGEQGEKFRKHIDQWTQAMPDTGYVTDFNQEVVFRFLHRKLVHIGLKREVFKERIRVVRDALKDLITMEDKKSEKTDPGKGFDFASGMIEMDKVKKMRPKPGSKVMDEADRSRVLGIMTNLEDALTGKENEAHLIVQPELEEDFAWNKIFHDCKVSFHNVDEGIEKAESVFDQNITSFTNVLIALRKADLILEGKYRPEVHDDYFDHFKWFKLEEDELELFPPVVVISNTDHLLHEGLSPLSKLLVKDKPINVMALTSRTIRPVDPDVDWEDASHAYRQEIAGFGLSHRGTHTLQCASDRPTTLMDGMYSAIRSISPSVMHLLLPEPHDDGRIAFLKINAAAAGRHFPYVAYDCNHGDQWGSRFDIEHNAQSDKEWPSYPFTYLKADGTENTVQLTFTYADYKAMTRAKVEELFFVGESYVTEDLIPIHEYVSLTQEESTGKVPFIWLVSEENRLVRAAVPYMWTVSCLERLDYWKFLQDIGGVNNFHVREALHKAELHWEREKGQEIEQLKVDHETELERVRNTAASEAMERLAGVLLNLDDLPESTPSPAEPSKKKQEKAQPAEETAAEEIEVSISEPVEEAMVAEPYVDSFKCTSCNDCIEKFPAVFEYNEDKQAEIKDATGGSYEDLVEAAEGCPASCIHPGLPLDTSEKGLDELVKRAEKFN